MLNNVFAAKDPKRLFGAWKQLKDLFPRTFAATFKVLPDDVARMVGGVADGVYQSPFFGKCRLVRTPAGAMLAMSYTAAKVDLFHRMIGQEIRPEHSPQFGVTAQEFL